MGGEGGAYGAFVGAALLEVIRNALLMQGINSNWQGAFVGVFIVLAVLLEKIRGPRRLRIVLEQGAIDAANSEETREERL